MQRLAYHEAAPQAFEALAATRKYLATCSISPQLRALVELRVSQINGCAYCVDKHSREARQAGERQQRLDCLPAWRECSFYDDRERAALAWAESLTRIEMTQAPDEHYAKVREQFSDRDLVDLTLIISMMNMWNRLAISFRKGPAEHRTAKLG